MGIKDKWEISLNNLNILRGKSGGKGNLHSLLCYYQCIRHDNKHFQQSLAMFQRGIWIIGWGNRLLQLTN